MKKYLYLYHIEFFLPKERIVYLKYNYGEIFNRFWYTTIKGVKMVSSYGKSQKCTDGFEIITSASCWCREILN